MKRKQIISLVLCISLLALTFNGIITADEQADQDVLPIQINYYLAGMPYKSSTQQLPSSDYITVTTLLIDLQNALTHNDQNQIESLSQQLEEYNIEIEQKSLNPYTLNIPQNTNPLTEEINNTFCYFHAAGTGNIVFALGVLVWEWLTSQVTNLSSAIELIILLLISVPLWAPILIINHLIPFRIMMLKSAVSITDGKITTIGAQGTKQDQITPTNPATVDLRLFSGITLTIPRLNSNQEVEDSFIFVSGIAGSATNV